MNSAEHQWPKVQKYPKDKQYDDHKSSCPKAKTKCIKMAYLAICINNDNMLKST